MDLSQSGEVCSGCGVGFRKECVKECKSAAQECVRVQADLVKVFGMGKPSVSTKTSTAGGGFQGDVGARGSLLQR